jgi:uncharacterized protein
MNSQSEALCIQKTRQWIQSFVITLNLCPFAKREIDKNSVRFQISQAETISEARNCLQKELEILNNNPLIETTLLIFPDCFSDFFHYLDLVDVLESAIIAKTYEGIYQLATFHPEYCFADTDMDDVTNYTNRSPYPMIHILREAQVEQAIAYYGDTTNIIKNNQKTLSLLGKNTVQRRLLEI